MKLVVVEGVLISVLGEDLCAVRSDTNLGDLGLLRFEAGEAQVTDRESWVLYASNYREMGLGFSHHISTTTRPFDLLSSDALDHFHLLTCSQVFCWFIAKF